MKKARGRARVLRDANVCAARPDDMVEAKSDEKQRYSLQSGEFAQSVWFLWQKPLDTPSLTP